MIIYHCNLCANLALLRLGAEFRLEVMLVLSSQFYSAKNSIMSKKTLNTQNLEALGATRLADLFIEVSQGNAEIKRRLRLELSHALGAGELAREVRKRLATIKRATSFVDWQKQRAFVKDLETQLDMISEKIAPEDPSIAFDLLWKFVELAPSVYERVDDSNGNAGDVFRYAITLFEDIASNAPQDPKLLAERIFDAISDNGYGQWDDVIQYVGPALGPAGIAALKLRIDAEEKPEKQPTDQKSGNVIQIGRRPVFQKVDGLGIGIGLSTTSQGADENRASFSQLDYRGWRQQIADLEGDVDGFLAQYGADDLLNPHWAARAAKRLLGAGRSKEALEILTKSRDAGTHRHIPHEWDATFADTLAVLGQSDALHTFRWEKFKETLSVDYLRDVLKALPDFEDVEAEESAKSLALKHDSFNSALAFFLEWPDHWMAANLISNRSEELNGDAYYSLTPAADQLQGEFPLAAVLCRRAMISYTLDKAKSTRYKHASRHFLECQSADSQIEIYGAFMRHDEFESQLKAKHPRKAGFWRGIV